MGRTPAVAAASRCQILTTGTLKASGGVRRSIVVQPGENRGRCRVHRFGEFAGQMPHEGMVAGIAGRFQLGGEAAQPQCAEIPGGAEQGVRLLTDLLEIVVLGEFAKTADPLGGALSVGPHLSLVSAGRVGDPGTGLSAARGSAGSVRSVRGRGSVGADRTHVSAPRSGLPETADRLRHRYRLSAGARFSARRDSAAPALCESRTPSVLRP